MPYKSTKFPYKITEETKPEGGTGTGSGGARVGAGRKRIGSAKNLRRAFYEELDIEQEAEDLEAMWSEYKTIALENARNGQTEDLQWILSRILPVPKEQDVTSNGESIATAMADIKVTLPSVTTTEPMKMPAIAKLLQPKSNGL